MPFPNNKIDVKKCAKEEKIHPCDPQLPCDPLFKGSNCPSPSICHERLKNPAYPGEITTCQSGSFMNVSTCEKVEPPHVCDPLKPCSDVEAELQKKPECREPPLCIERIKNNRGIMKEEPCDKTK